ncbi:MAG: hypothetical protein Q8P46_00510 [Hyphomicrobiales bacterium]|nr:hypothetical protein [Hyphomicrobiales bacterium]
MAGSGISMQSALAIKRLDDGEEGGLRRVAAISSAPTEYVTQGVTAPRPMTSRQQDQLRALINRRPDAAAFSRPLTKPK